jgi:hypothetical protein
MQGGHWGTDDLSTYLDMSGRGGHSVLSIYLDMSGMGGHGGTVDLRIHLLGSGRGHAGHPGSPNCCGLQEHDGFAFPHPPQFEESVDGGHPQGLGALQRSQVPFSKCSTRLREM